MGTRKFFIKHKKAVVNILMPLLYAGLTVLVILLAVTVFGKSYLNAAKLLFLDTKPDFSASIKNSYKPSANIAMTIDIANVEVPAYETEYAALKIERPGVKAPIIFGDSDKALQNGVGQYNGSYIPGYGGTILIGGHNNSYFKTLKDVVIGDIVEITTSYGVYKYQVTETKIAAYNDKSVFSYTKEKEILVLYTCYPFNAISRVSDRFYVLADYISGPKIIQEQ